MKRYVLAGALLFTTAAFAQEFRAKMTGRVVDPSGAVVPKATVVVKNTDTGVEVHLQTDKSGTYTAPFLLPGTYSIQVSAPGFQSFLHDGITLLTSQTVQEDASLTVGSGTEEVRVTAEAPLVDASTATVAQVLTAEDIEDLPANGRSPLALAKTELGVVPKAKNLDVTSRPFDNTTVSDFSVGGGNSQSNEYLLNGVPNNQDSSRVSGFSPQLDSVDSVRVDVFSSDASLGDTSGGTINLTTKGGTNIYHGTVSEFNQFSAINAPQRWFVPSTTVTPATRQNQYGVTLGGPIVIPKLYNGHDRLFFFYSFERFTDSVPNPVTGTVPTVAERGGDFSALLNIPTTGASYQLYNPYSGVLSGTKVVRSTLSGNKVPTTQINPIAEAYLQFIPLPNLPGLADGENNYFSNVPTRDDYGSHAGRIDISVNDRNKIFFETHRSEYFRTLGNVFNNLSTGTTTYTVYQGGVVDYIHTFSPTTTLDSRISLTRYYNNSSLSSNGFDATTLGFPSYLQNNSSFPVLPRITFSETSGTVAFGGLSTTPTGPSAFDTFQIFAALTKVVGRHTLKIGPDLRLEKSARLSPGSPSGAFTFGQNFVDAGSGNTGVATSVPFGASFAEFLYGLPTAGTQTIANAYLYNAAYFAGFVQDDWRALPSLTVNLGLRFEHETPITESGNRAVVGFDPNATNSATAGSEAKYATIFSATRTPELPVANFTPTGGISYANGSHRNEYNTPAIYISPRIGLAYSPPNSKGQTAVRAGVGVFVNPFNDYNTPQSYGYTATTALVPTNNGYLTPATTLSDPFPASNPIQQPTGSALGVNTNLGSGIVFRGPNLQVPYALRYSLDIQQQLSRGVMLDIGYIGAHQVHLSYTNAVSQVGDYPYLSRSRRADPNAAFNTATNPCGVTPTQNLTCLIANPFLAQPNVTGAYATSATLTKYQLLQSFPEYTGVTQQLVPGASAKFNELLARLHFRETHGFNFNANYEWSHALITGQLTPGGPLSYQESTSDYPQHFSFEGGYRVPFGHGQKFFNHNNILGEALGGFQLNAIYAFLSGTPISWGSTDLADGQTFDQNFQSQPRNYVHTFNTAHFYTGTGTGYANCVKGVAGCVLSDTGQPSGTYNVRTFPSFFLRSDHTDNLDASITKSFYAGERFKIEYRFEAFNVLNHTQFGAPNVGPTSLAFGTINTIQSVNRTLQQGLRVAF